jgi:hypothetical protein
MESIIFGTCNMKSEGKSEDLSHSSASAIES